VSGVGDDNVMKTLHSLLIIAVGAVLMKNYHQEKELKPDSVINIKYITYNSNSNKVVTLIKFAPGAQFSAIVYNSNSVTVLVNSLRRGEGMSHGQC